MCGVENAALPTICGPHHSDVTTNRGHSKDRDNRSTFSRTHVYLMTLCVIFGAQPSYRQITSSSVSLAWMCSRKPARDDAILHDCSIIQVQWAKGKHQIEYTEDKKEKGTQRRQGWQTEVVMNEKKVRCTCTHTVTQTEVLEDHVWSEDSGVPWDCVFQDDLQPLSDTMIQNWVSLMKYIITTHLMNQKAVWRNIGNIFNR